MKWNKKMVRYVMTLIIAVGRNLKLIMALNLCMMPLNKIIDINCTHGSLKKSTEKNILWRVTIFLFLREWVIEMGYS